MSDATPPKRKPGRPPAAPGENLDATLALRVESSLKQKCKDAGDEWVRTVLRKAKPPTKP